jgi:DMSO/TMAO reductase YedYZ molybdopterin-dependent catalytic subunit
MKRRNVLVGLAAFLTAGCAKISKSETFTGLVDGAEKLHKGAQRMLGGGQALAREYTLADISPSFRGNGNTEVDSDDYRAHLAAGFADWRLNVGGLVERPLSLSLEDVRALPQRTQITRHDCDEGWSAIGQWTGPQLSAILEQAGVKPEARYIVFRCADSFGETPYYESCDLNDAMHPQTIVAHQLNGEPLPVANGAPLRMRLERQLGYKHAKYLTAIEAVDRLEGIGNGGGGYWEDKGYQWYAGV